MCGINGFTFEDKNVVSQMNEKIRHRGPDDQGIYTNQQISLGSVRLSILDLSANGKMPMTDKSGRYVLVYNGEIYNYKELKQPLLKYGYTFKSNTDTEVILNAFHNYGVKALSLFNGMFALALWDKKEHSLLLARDRVGIKPLYYAVVKSELIFSSEIKAITLHQIQKSINPLALALYMRLGYVPAPYTIYHGIYKIQPGEYLTWQKGSISKHYFWKPNLHVTKATSYEEARIRLRRMLEEAVASQLVSDRPLGVFLSGGIDSTIVAALTQKIVKHRLNTFSMGFDHIKEQDKFNADAKLAKKTAHYLGTKHHEFSLSPAEACDTFHYLSALKDEPLANPTHIPTAVLAKKTRERGIVVALGGDGGDELFGGYTRYKEAWLHDIYQFLPQVIRETVGDNFLKLVKRHQSPDFMKNLQADDPVTKYLIYLGTSETQLAEIYQPEDHVSVALSQLRGFKDLPHKPFHQLFPYLDFMHWLPEESLMRSDKMTMLYGLEQRVPLLDNRLIDFSLTLPFSWKLTFHQSKRILKDACRDVLPDHIRQAPKRGFFSPGSKWLRQVEWQDLISGYLSTAAIKESGYFDSLGVSSLFTDHLKGKRYGYPLLWHVLEFQAWYYQVFRKS